MTLEGLETSFFLTLMRIAPIIILAPFFGAKTAPVIARVGLAVFLAILYLPICFGSMQTLPAFNSDYYFLCCKELLIGLFLGLFILTPFLIAQSSGVIVDFMRGSSMLMAQDPTTQTQASPIGILYNWLLIVIYFGLDGPFYFLYALESSFALLPITEWLPPFFFTLQAPIWVKALSLLQALFAMSIQLAAPPILAILMAEVFLGIANRLAPQVQIAFLGMSLKSLFGLGLLWAAWFLILKQMGSFSLTWTKEMANYIATG